ncbi:immunoglobulin J chain [Bombina bombina]|uniref:immunoglobulin J chain n=1 Tax=Bombina bombina TaxID=8345 RepID=UPI00235ABB7A|nr:immunoglobulin J chain [Bombina bombina]
MQSDSIMLAALLLMFGTSIYVTGQYFLEDENVLVDNKCKCIKVTSKFVPSKENPKEEILERNIEIRIPLKSRMNISDPTSPLRTNFVYRLSDLFKKCDPVEVEIGGETVLASQDNCDHVDDTCYTYDRRKCYTVDVPFTVDGKTIMRKAALNPESCHE